MKRSIPLFLLAASLGATGSSLFGQDALPADLPPPARAPAPGAAPVPPGVPRVRTVGVAAGGGGGGYATAGAMGGSEDAFRYEVSRNINFLRNPPGRTLVLRGAGLDEAKAGELEEDLNVMSRLLDKSMDRTAGGGMQDKVLGITVSGLPGSNLPQNLYLDGYGAVFIMNARFPVVPPANEDKDEKQPRSESSSSWDDARRELYGAPRGMPGMEPFERTPVRYDADKVETLKKEIMDSLKNASNIRHLKSDDFITVTIQSGDAMFVRGFEFRAPAPRASAGMKGPGPSEVQREQSSARGRAEVDAARVEAERVRIEVKRAEDQKIRTVIGDGRARNSALTIRIKKSDVDSFAKGKLDLDSFRKKASVTIY